MDFSIESLLITSTLANTDPQNQVDALGELFDQSLDQRRLDGIEHGIALASTINFEALSSHQQVLFHYCLSNAWSTKRILLNQTREKAWEFNMLEISKEIYHLRKAISLSGFQTIDDYRKCQIYTNLGNTFDFIGRFVESQELWSKAIAIIPDFPLALANKAKGLYHYANYLIDDEHSKLLVLHSYKFINKSIESSLPVFEDTGQGIAEFKRKLEDLIPPALRMKIPDLNDYDLGNHHTLNDYRHWCLQHTLYVNPLNDLGAFSMASHDILMLPTMHFDLKSPPVYLTFYNLMKQEFGSARFLFYESLKSEAPHYSDEDIALVETYETALYSLPVEKAKMAFRMAYSILDKIAFFLSDYFALGIDHTKINFRSIWYTDYKNRTLRPEFTSSYNWALRGLFWLSKDLHLSWEQNEIVIEPEAKEIAAIRNHIEHKFFKIVRDRTAATFFYDEEKDIAFTISKDKFYPKVLKLLKLVRASLIYLPLVVNQEQQKRPVADHATIPIQPTIIPKHERY